mmetsp:Transcript_81656/g.144020  ORF Transcript_81656/g.144020 Transcript_81656/m.144020 type:complete len:230 (-) Transcript_81656:3582-4271(-)
MAHAELRHLDQGGEIPDEVIMRDQTPLDVVGMQVVADDHLPQRLDEAAPVVRLDLLDVCTSDGPHLGLQPGLPDNVCHHLVDKLVGFLEDFDASGPSPSGRRDNLVKLCQAVPGQMDDFCLQLLHDVVHVHPHTVELVQSNLRNVLVLSQQEFARGLRTECLCATRKSRRGAIHQPIVEGHHQLVLRLHVFLKEGNLVVFRLGHLGQQLNGILHFVEGFDAIPGQGVAD